MDPVSKLIASGKSSRQVGQGVHRIYRRLFQWLFDAHQGGAQLVVEGATSLLLQLPPVLLAVILAGFAYGCSGRSRWPSACLLGLLFIINQGLWKETVQTLVLVVAATALSMAIGVPLGIWAAHKPGSGRSCSRSSI